MKYGLSAALRKHNESLLVMPSRYRSEPVKPAKRTSIRLLVEVLVDAHDDTGKRGPYKKREQAPAKRQRSEDG